MSRVGNTSIENNTIDNKNRNIFIIVDNDDGLDGNGGDGSAFF